MRRKDLCGRIKWEEEGSSPVCPAGFWKQMKKSGIEVNSGPFLVYNLNIFLQFFLLFCHWIRTYHF